jgi:hypothetical protein
VLLLEHLMPTKRKSDKARKSISAYTSHIGPCKPMQLETFYHNREKRWHLVSHSLQEIIRLDAFQPSNNMNAITHGTHIAGIPIGNNTGPTINNKTKKRDFSNLLMKSVLFHCLIWQPKLIMRTFRIKNDRVLCSCVKN